MSMSILELNAASCKNCYKCIRFCPVKSISFRNQVAQIVDSDCILCGNCINVCPQNARTHHSQIDLVSDLINSDVKVFASVAPSFAAYFDTDFATLREALIELGFDDAFETAEGAYMVKTQFEEILRANPGQTYISSCCAAVNNYIRKFKPRAFPYLMPVLTPAQAHAKLLHERYPNCEVVFIGPCVAKLGESQEDDSEYDSALLFEDLESWFEEEDIVLDEKFGRNTSDPKLSRLFPKTGGVLQTMSKEVGWRYLTVDGYQDCISAIDDVIAGRLPNCFLEMNLCTSGCVGGPSFRKKGLSTVFSELKVRNSANTRDHDIDFNVPEELDLSRTFKGKRIRRMPPSAAQIQAVLQQLGKNSPEDELNCGMCGYPTCREKARAVLQGKAEVNMCLPYMRERAESFANKVIDILPSALLSVDMDLRIQQINNAACEIFNISAEAVIGQPVSRLLDEYEFINLISSGEETLTKRAYLTDYKIYLEQTYQFDKGNGVIVVTLKDITNEKAQKRQNMQAKIQAAAMADSIVDKHLRTVHEIAFLLGETAAETKAAIMDLKNTMLQDDDESR